METNRNAEKQLDKAIEKTFPASDPVAPKHVTGTEPPGSDPKRKPPKISPADVAAAAQDTETCPNCGGTGLVEAPTPTREVQPCPACLGHGRVVPKKDPVDTLRPGVESED